MTRICSLINLWTFVLCKRCPVKGKAMLIAAPTITFRGPSVLHRNTRCIRSVNPKTQVEYNALSALVRLQY